MTTETEAPAFNPVTGIVMTTEHYACLMAMAHTVRDLLAAANAGEANDPVERAILHGVVLFDKDAPVEQRFTLTSEAAGIFAHIDQIEQEIAASTEVEVREAVS